MKGNTYVENTLTKGEEIRYQGKVLPAYHLTMVPLVIVLEVILLFAGVGSLLFQAESGRWLILLILLSPLLAVLQSWSVIKTTEIAVTNLRVITTTGLFTRSSSEMALEKVESVDVEQGVFGRLLGYGSVSVNGTGGRSNPAPGIANPFEFRRIVQEAVEQKRGA
jgi:uncharacterized membrane protein YdbT with pleckstrin-like domain